MKRVMRPTVQYWVVFAHLLGRKGDLCPQGTTYTWEGQKALS